MEKDLWKIENELFAAGFSLIAGTDEAGRGPLAGPVYAAAVVLPRNAIILGLDDSKKLSPKKREELFVIITSKAITYSVASSSVKEIEKTNILEATLLAMRRAVSGLNNRPEFLLIDGNISRGFDLPSKAVIGGDALSASIAAASILAKVSRDRYMLTLAKKYPDYRFEKHKGYGTREHQQAILRVGPCPEHRLSFLRKLNYQKGRQTS